MKIVQASGIGAATTAIISHALAQGLEVGSMQTGEHADGSGRWHVLLTAFTRATLDEVEMRVLINEDGSINPIEILRGATHSDPSEPGRQAAIAATDNDPNHPAHPCHW